MTCVCVACVVCVSCKVPVCWVQSICGLDSTPELCWNSQTLTHFMRGFQTTCPSYYSRWCAHQRLLNLSPDFAKQKNNWSHAAQAKWDNNNAVKHAHLTGVPYRACTAGPKVLFRVWLSMGELIWEAMASIRGWHMWYSALGGTAGTCNGEAGKSKTSEVHLSAFLKIGIHWSLAYLFWLF